jgi:hypothetical protein
LVVSGATRSKKKDAKEDLYEHDFLLNMSDDDEEERAIILNHKATPVHRGTVSASPATKSEQTIIRKMPLAGGAQAAGILDKGEPSDSESDHASTFDLHRDMATEECEAITDEINGLLGDKTEQEPGVDYQKFEHYDGFYEQN